MNYKNFENCINATYKIFHKGKTSMIKKYTKENKE
jgi:hypothetical protein